MSDGLNSRIGSGKKIDALLSNTNLNPNPKINVIAMTKEHQFFYGTDTRGKPLGLFCQPLQYSWAIADYADASRIGNRLELKELFF